MWPRVPHGTVSGMTTSTNSRTQPAFARRFDRRLATAGLPLVATASLLLGGVSAASAAPVSSDPTGCSATLARAAAWPGSFSDRTGTHRISSDAYYSYLLRQPSCAVIQ
jgi:hypothetical protein